MMPKALYIEKLNINRVRHLSNLEIPITPQGGKIYHLLLTGKNGSGKTSVLDALASYLDRISGDNLFFSYKENLHVSERELDRLHREEAPDDKIASAAADVTYWRNMIESSDSGVTAAFSIDERSIYSYYERGDFILAYFKAERVFDAVQPKHIEKVVLKDKYAIKDEPRKDFLKYLGNYSEPRLLSEKNRSS